MDFKSNRGRIVNVFITDKGRIVLKEAVPVARKFIDHIMSSVTENNASNLTQTLEVLRDNAYDGLESIAKEA